MKKCVAFQPLAGSRTAWVPCARKAEAGSAFCRKHGDAAFGMMLGALVYAPARNEMQHLCEEDDPCPLARNQGRA